MTTYINLNGDNGVGKSTICLLLNNALLNEGYKVKVAHLADPVKKICAILANETIINYHNELKDCLNSSLNTNRRELMLLITSVAMRVVNKDVFWKIATDINNRKDYDFIIIGDARYFQWYRYLEDNNFKQYNMYISKKEEDLTRLYKQDYIRYDTLLINDCSMTDLLTKCSDMVNIILAK